MLHFYIIFFLFCVQICNGFDIELTIEVPPGKRECFHQPIQKLINFEVEYQVIDGGDLDINFVVQSPTGRVLISTNRKTESLHKMQAAEEGDYIFCLDNTFSRFSQKLVFFELLTDEDDGETIEDSDYEMDSRYEMKVADFREKMSSIKAKLDISMSSMNMLKSVEARDRHVQERNFERVNFWSGLHLFVMLSVSLVQVLMIRSLFMDNNKMSKIMKIRT